MPFACFGGIVERLIRLIVNSNKLEIIVGSDRIKLSLNGLPASVADRIAAQLPRKKAAPDHMPIREASRGYFVRSKVKRLNAIQGRYVIVTSNSGISIRGEQGFQFIVKRDKPSPPVSKRRLMRPMGNRAFLTKKATLFPMSVDCPTRMAVGSPR